MKKILFFTVLTLVSYQGFSWPVVSRITSGGVFGGYWETSKELVEYDEGKYGWKVICNYPGLSGCYNGMALQNEDPQLETVDFNAVKQLMTIADEAIESGGEGAHGTETLRISVEGENFERLYVLTWSVGEDGSTSTLIDRTDIY